MRNLPWVFRCTRWSLALTACGCSGADSANSASSSQDGGDVLQDGGLPRDDSGVASPVEAGNQRVEDASATDASVRVDAGDATIVTDGPAPDTQAQDATGIVNPHPTVSSWVGTNVAADLARVDVTYQLNPFDTPAAQRDADGYPVAGASGTSSTDLGFVLPTGMYNISYQGSGAVAVSGIGKLGSPWQPLNGEQRSTVQITAAPGAFGNFLTLTVTNGAGQSVHGIHIYYPGFDYDSPATFLPQFLSLLGPFRAMRFMDWESTNASTLTNWVDRPASAHFGQSTFGEPYEHIAELVNETGKDCWITIPELATNDFITRFAQFMATSLDFSRIQAARDQAGFTTPFQVIVENSNETWNQGFTAYGTFLAAANAKPTRYTGMYSGAYGPAWMSGSADLMKVAQYEADRLVQIGDAFRTAFGAMGKASVVAPVLSGWALGAVFSDEGLQFIKANYGDPKRYVVYVAQAPYFATADDTTTGTLDALFPALQANIAGMDTTLQDFAKLGVQYGVGIVAYEGGQSLTGTTNQRTKHLAQHDVRMYDAYKAYFALWQKDLGASLFMHFNLAGQPGLPENIYQYGYWGSIAGVLEDPAMCEPNLPRLIGSEPIVSVVHHCPKYRALAEQVPP
ncbi:MAG: hypothetical protein M3O46_08710 [Myxococcota bacterium]|nr:hypothetical protein [Myxococcota bacterium]